MVAVDADCFDCALQCRAVPPPLTRLCLCVRGGHDHTPHIGFCLSGLFLIISGSICQCSVLGCSWNILNFGHWNIGILRDREIGWIDLGTVWMFFLFFNSGFHAGGGCILQEGFGPSVDSGPLS